MTKKDCIAIAQTISEHEDDFLGPIKEALFVRSLMVIMAKDNPRFDRARFWKACGLKEDTL
jgi:hypothetical protein